MALKKYYIIFEVKSKPPNSRYYIGKQITYNPKDKYLGEKDCNSLRIALTHKPRENFVKRIIKLCSSEEELNEEYDKMITPEVLTRWKYYNCIPKKRPPKSEESKKAVSNSLKNFFKNNKKNIFFYHTDKFKKEQSRKYEGAGNPNWKGGISKSYKRKMKRINNV